jgi:hypothetical protein
MIAAEQKAPGARYSRRMSCAESKAKPGAAKIGDYLEQIAMFH